MADSEELHKTDTEEEKPSAIELDEDHKSSKKIGRCFELLEEEPLDSIYQKVEGKYMVHHYIEVLEDKSIALELVDEQGEPTGTLRENISLDEFAREYTTCSQHKCPLEPRTLDEIAVKMSENRTKLGEELREEGKLEEAEDKFNRALTFDENNIRATLGLGEVKLEQNKIDEALEIFNKLSEENQIYEEANKHTLNEFGIYLRKKDLYRRATDMYEKAISIAPEDEALYFNLARAYVEISNKEEDRNEALETLRKAITILREAISIRCDFKEGIVYLERLIDQEKELFRKLLEEDVVTKDKPNENVSSGDA